MGGDSIKKYLGGKETNETKNLPQIVKPLENYPMRAPLKQYRREIINPPREKIASIYRENSPIKKTENEYIAKQQAYYPTKAPAPVKPVPQNRNIKTYKTNNVAKQPAYYPQKAPVKPAPQNRNVQVYRTNSIASSAGQRNISNINGGAKKIVKTEKYDIDKYKNYPGELERFLRNKNVSIKPPQPVKTYEPEKNSELETNISEMPETEMYCGESGRPQSNLAKWIVRAALIAGFLYMLSNFAECSTQKSSGLENRVLTEKYFGGKK